MVHLLLKKERKIEQKLTLSLKKFAVCIVIMQFERCVIKSDTFPFRLKIVLSFTGSTIIQNILLFLKKSCEK